jgi:excisionase family DNA binding protein
MLTVSEAARRIGRDPETVRRWIRSGRLRAHKVGTQHVIDESDLDVLQAEVGDMLALPDSWRTSLSGDPMPNVVAALRRSRAGH